MTQPLPQHPRGQDPFNIPEPEQGNAYYPYGRPRYANARPIPVQLKPVNGNAIISFFLALFGISIPAIIVGHVALYQLSFLNMERGKALAWVGLILAYLETIAWVVFGIWAIVHVMAFFAALSSGFLIPGMNSPTATPSDGGLGELLKELNSLAAKG